MGRGRVVQGCEGPRQTHRRLRQRDCGSIQIDD